MRNKKPNRPAIWLRLALGLVLLCACGTAVYFLLSHEHRSAPPAPASAQSNAPPKDIQDKTYCEPTTQGCFTYPADWTNPIRSVTGSSPIATFGNKTSTIYGQYLFTPPSYAANTTFYTVSSTPVTIGGHAADLVGGFYTAGISITKIPSYRLVDASQERLYGFSAGSSVHTTTNLGIILSSGWVIRLTCGAGTQASTSGAAWFKTSDAQTCATILKSLYFK